MKNQLSLSLVFAASMATIAAPAANANNPIELVRVLCIPEADFFSAEVQAFDDLGTFANASEESKQILLGHQLIYPEENPKTFHYECKLKDRSIVLTGNRAPLRNSGECSLQTQISFSLQMSGNPILQNVYAMPWCHDAATPHISSLTFDKGLFIVNTHAESPRNFVLKNDSTPKFPLPLTQSYLQCLDTAGYYKDESPNRSTILNECKTN